MSISPSLKEALAFWWKLGWISFGGPAGQIAMVHEEVVERQKWVKERDFVHGLNFAMLLPGPEAHQLVIYLGWRLHGTWGGVLAGTLFLLPAVLLLWILSWVYVTAGTVGWVAGIFHGLLPAVVAIVAAAVLRIGKKALKHPLMWCLAIGSFVGIFFLKVPFPLIILSAAGLGLIVGWRLPLLARKIRGGRQADADDLEARAAWKALPGIGRWVRVLGGCLALWWAPILVCGAVFGWDSLWVSLGVFFSKAALVTFGGAYAVLPYVAQQAVEQHRWLDATQMMAGLALAETTPGPLIMVLQFVGFLAGWFQPGTLSPLLGATLGALLVTWVTFLPGYLFVLLGAPYIERLGQLPVLSTSLGCITAAVAGVMANLGLWFALQAFFINGQAQVLPLVLVPIYFIAVQRFGLSIVQVVAVGALVGFFQGLV